MKEKRKGTERHASFQGRWRNWKNSEEIVGIADVELKHYTRSGWSSLLQDKI